ncbi:hypothetical protein QWY15_12800 [Planococcus sp. N064]|uniref:Uncharacterized protein n=1 Tax=Planococcus liqunii TaxID=3058394 RepID=A0ABT8MTV8_9BACL|nr:hypothetical protein [Planococcus sp. N064]MDN7228179.1 hypothetical protein [Planococcus sp. N064]
MVLFNNYFINVMESFETLVLISFAIIFFIYVYLTILVLLIIINLIFFIMLKQLFPYEEGEQSSRIKVDIKELSKFMSISDQVAYTVYSIVVVLVIFIMTIFIVKFLLNGFSLNESKDITGNMFSWFESDLYTVGNFFGLLSIAIALLSITIPSQTRIYNFAYKKYEEYTKNLRERQE